MLCPLQHKRHGAVWQISPDDLEGTNVNQRFELSIKCVEVGRNMISEVHLNQDSIKSADRWHSWLYFLYLPPSTALNDRLSP